MKTILENIYNISYNSTTIHILCSNNIIICAPIINGTIKINIFDIDNNNIGINGLDINDNIKIYYKENINNMIKPIKIIKLNNYKFNDESSASDEDII